MAHNLDIMNDSIIRLFARIRDLEKRVDELEEDRKTKSENITNFDTT